MDGWKKKNPSAKKKLYIYILQERTEEKKKLFNINFTVQNH